MRPKGRTLISTNTKIKHTMEIERDKKFNTQASVWDVELDDTAQIYHNGYVVCVFTKNGLERAAEEMAAVVRDSILAMPDNDAVKLSFACTWTKRQAKKKGGVK